MYLPQTIERVTLRSAARSRRSDVRVHVFAFSGLQAMIGANLQSTLQVGNNNSATTTQTASVGVTNSSVTAQFGSHNTAVVTQH